MSVRWKLGDELLTGSARRQGTSILVTNEEGTSREFVVRSVGEGDAVLQEGTQLHRVAWAKEGQKLWVFQAGRTWELDLYREGSAQSGPSAYDTVVAPMTGKLLAIEVQPGDSVAKDQVLGVMEAMKMQCDLKAPREGIVGVVPFQPGDQVPGGAVIVALEEETEPA